MESIRELIGIKLNKEEVLAVSQDLAKLGSEDLSETSKELLVNMGIDYSSSSLKDLLEKIEELELILTEKEKEIGDLVLKLAAPTEEPKAPDELSEEVKEEEENGNY
jgi:hypothetical protein